MNDNRSEKNRPAAALIVVLFVIMTVTVLSVGFLTRSDVELACGRNMLLRTQMDYLAESGLEHAKGLILNPQDVSGEYWKGAKKQQLVAGSDDFYDVNVVKLDECNYQITCDAYRQKGGDKTSLSSRMAELRLDPCIAFSTDSSTVVWDGVVINGDVRCDGTLTNNGQINGDVYASIFSGNGAITGQQMDVNNVLLDEIPTGQGIFNNPGYYIGSSHYWAQEITPGSYQNVTWGPTPGNPAGVYYCNDTLKLNGNVTINGSLRVLKDLVVSGSGNSIEATKNFPALEVWWHLLVRGTTGTSALQVTGNTFVEGYLHVNADAEDVGIDGMLYAEYGMARTTRDWSNSDVEGMLEGNPTPVAGRIGARALSFDGIDDYVRTRDSEVKMLPGNTYTLAVWVDPNPVQKQWAGIMSKAPPDGSTNHWTLQFDDTANRNVIVVHGQDMTWSTGIKLHDVDDGWHHIAVVRDGHNKMTSYLDGNPVVIEQRWDEPPLGGRGHLNIGADRTGSPDYVYTGAIDDVRVYDLALSANEVISIYQQTGEPHSLIGHWKFEEEGTGGNVTITAAPNKAAIKTWSALGTTREWSPAAGAFFKSIERKSD